MEEITTAIVTALSTGAGFVAKETAGEIVKDSYTNLKNWLQSHYPNVSIAQLERQPTSKARQEVVREDLESEGVSRDSELIKLAGTIIELIQKETRDTAATIGVDLGELERANVTFGNVLAGRSATAVKVGRVTDGNLSFGDVTADPDTSSTKKS